MAVARELVEAYQNAEYVVSGSLRDAPDLVLRVGVPSAALDELLQDDLVATAAFITPENPHGRRQSARENAAAFLDLNSRLNKLPYKRYPAQGRDPKGRWPAEAGVLLLGIPRAQAEALGRELAQNAIVFVEKGRAPELVLLA